MSNNTFTLADIRAAAEKKYGDFPVELGPGDVVVLRNALRLSKSERAALKRAQESMKAEDADEQVLLEDCIRIVAAPGQGQRLVDAIGGDLTVLAETFSKYAEGTEAGEASGSES